MASDEYACTAMEWVRPMTEQFQRLHEAFPGLDIYNRTGSVLNRDERYRNSTRNKDCWLAIPRWQAVATTYKEALRASLQRLHDEVGLENRLGVHFDQLDIRPISMASYMLTELAKQQGNPDVVLIPMRFGHQRQDQTPYECFRSLRENEFPLGAFAITCMMITHLSIRGHMGRWMGPMGFACAGDTVAAQGRILVLLGAENEQFTLCAGTFNHKNFWMPTGFVPDVG